MTTPVWGIDRYVCLPQADLQSTCRQARSEGVGNLHFISGNPPFCPERLIC